MATGREYLQSIMIMAGRLQNRTDAELEDVADELHDADEAITAADESLASR